MNIEEVIIRVKCPHCGFEFNTRSIKTVKCRRCGRSFKVFYKKRSMKGYAWASRIVKIVEGSRMELFKKFNELRLGK